MILLVVSFALKGALVLGVAFALTRLLRAAPAALRHGIWTAAFAALLLLPVLDAVGPAWQIPLLPAQSLTAPAVPPAPPAPPAPPPPPAPPAAAPVAPLAPLQPAAPLPPAPPPPAPPAPVTATLATAHAASDAGPALGAFASRSWVAPLVRGIGIVWALGVLVVLLGWATAHIAAWRLVRSARPMSDPDWLDALQHARLLAGVERDVRLLESDRLDVPIAWGFSPLAVVVPSDAGTWNADRRDAVALHEMAHLRRDDARTQLLAQVAVALHWPNPLAWLAYRRFLLEREHACDDAVLRGGTAPSAYAGHLVEIARGVRRGRLALSAVSPMARPSHLEGRVLTILDGRPRRPAPGRASLVAVVALGLAVVLPLAAFQPVEADGPESLPVAPEVAVAVTPSVAPEPVPDPEPTPDPEEVFEREVPVALAAARDTIPRAEDVLGPALRAALTDLDALRAEGAYGLSSAEWDEIGNSIRDAFDEAYVEYDEAIAEALIEAEEALEERDWESELRSALAVARRDRAQAMREAQSEIEAAQRAIRESRHARDRALRDDAQTLRERDEALRDAHRAREQALREGRRAREQALREGRRAAEEARSRARSEARSSARREARAHSTPDGYAYSVTDNGTVIVGSTHTGPAAWAQSLDGLETGLQALGRSLSALERSGSADAATLDGLEQNLKGMKQGLYGITRQAQAWAESSAEQRIVRERLGSARERYQDLHERLQACRRSQCD